MELSQFTDYPLRVLIRAVTCKHGERASPGGIAQIYAISCNPVAKVTLRLSIPGYLGTVRGRGGGLVPSLPASQIGIGECLNPNGGNCCISLSRKLKRIFAEARDSFLECLERYSLDEITRSQATLALLPGATGNRLS